MPVNGKEETRILDLIKQGRDKEVIPILYKKVLPAVKGYVSRKSGSREDAHDAFHDALMLFYEQVIKGSFDTKYNIYGYLYRISIFRWINKVKKDKNFILTEEFSQDIKDESGNHWEFKEKIMDKNLLQELFSAIGDKCIELLNYTIFSEMLMEDVMVRMNFSSVEAVRMQQLRCKKKLLKIIEDNPLLLKRLKGE